MKKILFYILLLNSLAVFSQDFLIQNGTENTCTGTFYDSGGAAGNYGNNESFVYTICPDVAGNFIQLDFTDFNTQQGADIMTIYNGPDTTFPVFGTFSGGPTQSPGFVAATQDNTSGCLTIEFTSNASANTDGWAATITCFEPCQTINSQIDTFSPTPNALGYIRVCPNEEITLTGSGTFSVDGTGATYLWDLGDGNTINGQTATFSYPTPGVYIVNLDINDTNTSIDPGGCTNNNLLNQVIQVATEPDFTGTQAAQNTLCFGETTTIDGIVTAVEFINDCTPPVSGTTFLPDGSGANYQTEVTVDCYDSSVTLTDVSQLVSICITMEHSYLGDLDIEIISPNGQTVTLKDYPGGGSANLGTPWATAGVDGQSTNTTPGVGAQYCFVPGNLNPTLVGGIVAGGIFPSGDGPGTYTDTFVPAGSYSSEDPLTGLVGSPLNGDWTISITDNIGLDNGYVFDWSIEFDPALQPPELSFTPVIVSEAWDADATITNTTGNTITVAPTTAGQYCYTYRAMDDFGCEYTEVVCIDLLPEVINDLPSNFYMCNPGAPPYIFDLTENDPILLAPSPNPGDLVITYHETLVDAQGNTNPIATPGTYTSSAILGTPQTIYVRIEYLTSDCYEIESFTINITTQPTIDPVPDLEECDDVSNDGFASFDLEAQTLGILGTQPATDFIVTYYTTLIDATAGIGSNITSPYINTINPEPIYVRVESATDATCFSVSPIPVFDLVVLTSDVSSFTTTPTCDGGTVTIVGTVGGVFSLNPDLGDGAVIDPSTGEITGGVSGTTYTIEYTTAGVCPQTSQETVAVLPLEDSSFTMSPTCDGAVATITGDAGGTFAFGAPLPTGGEVIDPATGLVTGGLPTTSYTIIYSTTGPCVSTTTQTFTSASLPTINSVPNIEECDDVSNDGFASFDLESQTLGILGGQPAADFIVTYYTTLIDATSGTGNLTSPYINTINPEPIYVRVDSATDATCFSVSPMPVFDLVVLVSDVPSFTTAPTCDGGTSTVTGTVGGIFSLNPDLGDGAVIDPATGEITLGTSGVTYTIEYTTMGICPQTSQETVTVLDLDDSSFIMSPTCDGGTATITGDAGGVFTFGAPLPTDGATIDPVTGLVSGGSPDTAYTVIYTTTGPCVSTTTGTFTSHPLPILFAPTALEVCDDGTPDGLTSIDLSIKNTEISGGNPNIQVTYYLTQVDADQEMNPLAIPYTNIVNNQIVYVRGEDINTSCYATTTLELIVEQAPIANLPFPLEFCDPDSDGFGEFDLESATLGITGGDPTLTVTYHETMADAQNNVNLQSSPYNNIVAYTQTIYVRVESTTIATDCATFVELQLIVHNTPDILDPPTPLQICDDNADGFAQFDLTSKDTEILNGLDPLQYTVTYYETQANAEAPMNPIVGTGSYTNITPNMQTIWVRVDDTLTGCYSITTLDLIVNALPVLIQPTPLSLCDYDNPGDEQEAFTLEDKIDEILNGQTGITISFHETQLGAENDTDEIFSLYTNTSNAQTIYVRAENDITGCISTITLDLRVEPLPSPATPTPLEVCDDDNDGFMTFDLDSKTIEILNGEPDVTISYHETMEDAENAVNPLTSPYANIVEDSQTIYVRAENDLTGCYAIVELQLNVLPSPEVPLEIDDYVICDDNNDGFAQFDLTTMDATILGSQLPADFILTYHTNPADAATGNNPIVEPTLSSYTNLSNPQTIYVHLESVANGCIDTGEFNLVVSLPPVPVFPTPLDVCDDDYYADWDGIAIFDLTVKDTEITGGNASWTVTYYETDVAAQAGTPAIDPANAYQNTVNPQTLYVRVTDGDTGCYAFTTLLIRVNPNPTPQIPLPIELCDDINTGNGDEVFDLTIRELDIINGEGGVSATYHETMADAEAGTGAIVDPTMYTNTSTPQTIYVRVTNDTTGCYTIVELQLIVNPLPEVVAVTDLIECEVNTDGFYDFDLESKTDEILNGQSPTDFMVTYHETLADAQAGVAALVSLYTNTTINTQTIYVNISNTTTGCDIATVSFNIEVQEGAMANMPLSTYIICDNIGDNDGIGQFNLTDMPNGDGYDYQGDLHSEILGGQDSMNYTITFYTTPEDAELGVNEIPTIYENTSNPQVIYVRVDNDTDASTICYDTTMLTLQVDPLPIFDIEDSYILCVDSPGGVLTTISAPIIDTGLSAMDYSFEWTDSTGLVVGTGSSFMPSYADSYTVVVINIATSCENMDSTLVIQSSPPDMELEITTLAFSGTNNIEATATGDGEYEFSLDGGLWVTNDPNTGSYTFMDVSSGEHTIRSRDLNGCGESEDTILVMDYPKYFTPNGNGQHETWNIIGIEEQVDAKIYIFDRYGKLLKQLSPTGDGWNGTFNGLPMPSSDYWFVVEYDELRDGVSIRKEFKAHFTLKR